MKKRATNFGKVVKAARKAAGLTREEFAERIGKSPRYIAALENEGQAPGFDTLCSVIVSLGLDPNLIFFPDSPANTEEEDRVIRLVRWCDDYQLSVVSATLEALLYSPRKEK